MNRRVWPQKVTSHRPAQARTPQERLARDRALHVLNAMRTAGMSLTLAAWFHGTSPKTVRKYVGGAVQRDARGQYRAAASDRLTRRLEFLTPHGKIPVTVRDSRAASRIARYHNAVKRFADTGDAEGLRAFQGQTLRVGKTRLPFVTDLDTVRRLAQAGELSLDSIYVRGVA